MSDEISALKEKDTYELKIGQLLEEDGFIQ